MRTICSLGSRERRTAWPRAFSVTSLMKLLTTVKLTSASRRALRTSCKPSRTFASVSRPRPRSFLKASDRPRWMLSNMALSNLFPLLDFGKVCTRQQTEDYRGNDGFLQRNDAGAEGGSEVAGAECQVPTAAVGTRVVIM